WPGFSCQPLHRPPPTHLHWSHRPAGGPSCAPPAIHNPFASQRNPMVKKVQKTSASSKASASTSPLSGAIKDSAQQIWLAGLGAFSKAQEEGGKAFESLVKEGLSIQRKTQAVAEERISEASSRMSSMA